MALGWPLSLIGCGAVLVAVLIGVIVSRVAQPWPPLRRRDQRYTRYCPNLAAEFPWSWRRWPAGRTAAAARMGGMAWIELDGAVNVRDLGGLPTRSDGRTVSGRLLRSDNLQELSAADVARLVDDI
ncbi:MAG TPA: tyrosine-protein phosphatase, partial [Streptosporangiaceae bacterium]|nr:tyrosine-protein phosphatase [Streptosporangiaceae bacterium]